MNWKKLKPYYYANGDRDGTKVETYAKKNSQGQIVAWLRDVTNPFGEKLPTEIIERLD